MERERERRKGKERRTLRGVFDKNRGERIMSSVSVFVHYVYSDNVDHCLKSIKA